MKAADGSVLTLTKSEEAQQVASAASEMKANPAPAGPSVSLAARSDVVEQVYFNEKAELAYARQVELTNGRWVSMINLLSGCTECFVAMHVIEDGMSPFTGQTSLATPLNLDILLQLLPCSVAPAFESSCWLVASMPNPTAVTCRCVCACC
jgi:hypothetical protein